MAKSLLCVHHRTTTSALYVVRQYNLIVLESNLGQNDETQTSAAMTLAKPQTLTLSNCGTCFSQELEEDDAAQGVAHKHHMAWSTILYCETNAVGMQIVRQHL
eukprot:3454910-Amphidinium_carterae.1